MRDKLAHIIQSVERAGLKVSSVDDVLPFFERPPAAGPRILFFSGGSALNGVAAALAVHTSNATHVITTFDSGGSSAELRRCFNIPAVGDLRHRLGALADAAEPGVREACVLFERRLGKGKSAGELLTQLGEIIDGTHAWSRKLSQPFLGVISEKLAAFRSIMPADFDLSGAAIGNLVLAADYLTGERSLAATIERFSALFRARGRVLPVCEKPLQLAASLGSGNTVIGQHRFAGKYESADGCKCPTGSLAGEHVNRLFYYGSDLDCPDMAYCADTIPAAIREADLICYPIGSFFSSLLATVSTAGTGRAINASRAKKLYIPNPGPDPESSGLGMLEQIEFLRSAVQEDSGANACNFLDYLVVDSRHGDYAGTIPYDWCAEHGVRVIDCDFALGGGCFPIADPKRLSLLLYLLALPSSC